VLLGVNHTRRWAPDVRELAADLRGGRFGRVLGASACYTKGVRNNGSHLFDLLAMLLGPVEVVAAGRARVDHAGDDPTVPCLLEAGGVPVAVTVGDARAFALFELALVTEAGTIAMEDGGMAWRERRVVDSPHFPGYRALGQSEVRPGRYEEAMTAAAVNLREAAVAGAPLACTGADALAAQGVAEAVRAAALPEAEGQTPS
jgi:predicted dehydrogenase